MICRDCELRIADGDFDSAVREHLEACEECRSLAEDLRENAAVLSAMRDEDVPVEQALACNGGFSRRYRPRVWIPAAVAAALVLVAITLPKHRNLVAPAPPARVAVSPFAPVIAATAPLPPPVVRKPRRRAIKPKQAQPEQELMVKMLTPDPDVVIYWIVDPKEKAE